jgi:tetratricopeptide (TPR) repeat protein
VKNADMEYIDQMQGRSGLAGFGPRAKQLEQLKIEKQKELDDFDQKYAKEIVSLKKQREKLLNEQDKELNVTNLKQAENLKPQLHALHRVWGLSLLECCRNEEALEKLETACNGGFTDGFAATSLGLTIAKLRLGKIEEASNTAVEALAQFPTHVGLWHAKGCLTIKQSGLEEAKHWFKEALKLQPDFMQSQLNLCMCQLQEGDVTEVVRKLRALYRTKQETSPLVVTYYGLALLASGDVAEAEMKFKQALALDAGYTKAMAALIMLYVQKDIEAEALQQFMIQRQ